MRIILLLSVIITFISCKKVENSSVIPPTEDPIKFNTNIDTVNTINSDSLKFTLSLESKIPSLGVTYFIDVANSSNSSIFKINGNTTSSYIDIVVNELKFKGSYKINIQVASKSDPTNSSGKTLSISRGSIYKNYLTTSYELSKYDFWYSSSQLFKVDGGKYLNNPFIDEQSVQVDINSDGYEDVFYFEGYDLNISPTPNPPPTIFFSTVLVNEYQKPNSFVRVNTDAVVVFFMNTYAGKLVLNPVTISSRINSAPFFLIISWAFFK
jgi:hypothetical protein